jgi:hypothetical protein
MTRLGGRVAACAGALGVAAGRALDAAGALPGVHEAARVRAGVPLAVTVVLVLAGALVGRLAARRPQPWRAVPAGAAVAVLLAGAPELVARHDVGAVAEPAALAGALVQALPVVLALLLAALLAATPAAARPPALPPTRYDVSAPAVQRVPAATAVALLHPRAPPVAVAR